MSKAAWDLATQVMDLYEQAKLKGQKLRLATLLHKPDFKQNYLTPIRSLSKEDQCSLLQRVVELDLSLSELQVEANKIKQQSALKVAFVKLTNVQSWEEAQEKFPHFATEHQLERFVHIDLKKSIPKTFANFCHRAKSSGSQSLAPSSASVKLRESTESVLVSTTTELNGMLIRQVDMSFIGASLILAAVDDTNSAENVAYTIKEINSYFGCHQFVAAALVSSDNYVHISEIWKRAFGTSETLFVADTSINRGMLNIIMAGNF